MGKYILSQLEGQYQGFISRDPMQKEQLWISQMYYPRGRWILGFLLHWIIYL